MCAARRVVGDICLHVLLDTSARLAVLSLSQQSVKIAELASSALAFPIIGHLQPSMEGGKTPAARDRYAGSVDALVSCLRPHVRHPSFIRYCEQQSEKIDKKLLWDHAPIIRALHALQPNLSFSKRRMAQALEKLAEEKGYFRDSPSMAQEWVKVCSCRLRTLGRHMAQSILKARGSTSSWVAMVMTHPLSEQAGLKKSTPIP